MNMNVTILGHVVIDNNISENATYTTAGSPAMFIDKVYKKFPDVLTNIISPYGVDFLPYTKEITIFPLKPTSKLTIIYENKSLGNLRTQKAFNREHGKPLPITEDLKQAVAVADVLFFAPLTPEFACDYIAEVMRSISANALKILIPQGYYRSFDAEDNVIQRDFIEADELIPFFDFVIVSDQDHIDMQSIAQKWAQKTHVIMTMGDKGAKYLYENESIVVPVEAVKPEDIVDSVGSGDIFSASFAYKYFLTKDMKKSLEFANIIARQCLFFAANNLQFTFPA